MENNPQTPNQSLKELTLEELQETFKELQGNTNKTIKKYGIAFCVVLGIALLIGIRAAFSDDPASIKRKDEKIKQYELELVKIRAEKDSIIRILAAQEETIKHMEESEISLIEDYNKTQDKLYELDKKSKQSSQRIDRFSSTDIKEYFARQYGQ